jgi:hypothetical protein
MLTLEKCKTILAEEAEELNVNDLIIIREWLEKLADITIESTNFNSIEEIK